MSVIVRVISAFIIGCFLGLMILIGVAAVIGIAAATMKIYSIILEFMR